MMKCWRLMLVLAALSLINAAFAARTYTNVQSPATGTSFPMGSTQSISYTITNTATSPNNGERIYEMRFRLNSGSTFSSSTAAPAGWTRTAYSTTSVTFRANSWTDAIAVGGASKTFTLVILMRTTSADATSERLRDMRGRFSATTTFNEAGRTTVNTPGLWTLRSLSITAFEITDLSGAPLSAITGGASFQLRMTVLNVSNTTRSVTSNPNPPTPTKTGTVTQTLTSTTGSPLNLAPGASGTIIFTYSTVSADNGTIFFTANAQNSATVTSSTAVSGTLSVSSFSASIVVSPSCQYAGSNITVTMTVSNGSSLVSVTGVTPSLTPAAGAPATFISGPTPASIASIPASGSGVFTWSYQVNSVGATNPFTFSGSATGTRGGSTVTTLTSTSTPSTRRGSFAATVNPTNATAGSTGVELSFDVINNGCANVSSVAITIPAGWTYAGDAYSLVNVSAVSAIETWTVSGANPIVFSAPNVAGQLPVTFSGDFNLVFSSTPAAATTSTFSLRVTDANGLFLDIPLNVTVDPFTPGTTTIRSWREDFR